MIVFLIIGLNPVLSAEIVGAPNSFSEIPSRPFCREQSAGSQDATLKIKACEEEKIQSGCLSLEPQISDKSVLRDCRKMVVCQEYESSLAYIKACTENLGSAWKDLLTGLFTGSATEAEIELQKKVEFLARCLDAKCKRSALGYYQKYFTKEQLGQGELSPKEQKIILDSQFRDPEVIEKYRSQLGAPLEALLKELFVKLSKEYPPPQKLPVPFKVPWSQRIVTSIDKMGPKNLSELLLKTGSDALKAANQFLDRIGVKNRACYDPIKVREMQCYAFFSIVDPMLAIGAVAKINSLIKLETRSILSVRVTKYQPLSGGITSSYKVQLDNGLHAVFKPCTHPTGLANCNAEVAAYVFDRRFGFNLVPETIYKEVNINGVDTWGSLQLFVNSKPANAWRTGSKKARQRQRLFDYLIGNKDRKAPNYNYLVDLKGNITSIDHGLAFRDAYAPSDFQSLPKDLKDFLKTSEGTQLLGSLQNVTKEDLYQLLAPYSLDDAVINSVYIRFENLRKAASE